MSDLFFEPSPTDDSGAASPPAAGTPLAERMRPRGLDEIVGQDKALGPDSALRAAVDRGRLPSLVLWGPPGCGKTTLAACLARAVGARLLSYSAVRVGVKELKSAMAEAARLRAHGGRAPVLFLDEIHRFNKAQQDALLPAVEAGDVVLIGATTENPSFEVISALLSRCRVVVLEPLREEDLLELLRRALVSPKGLAPLELSADEEALKVLARRSGGDARFALGSLELAAQALCGEPAAAEAGRSSGHPEGKDGSSHARIDRALAEKVVAEAHLVYDRAGEEHFNVISALHKSLRNSDAQAGLYWLARMLEAGEDPLYVARRMIRFASEDVGLADPHALVQAVAAFDAVHRIGMPEAALALAQAVVYLAQAPKSNALYRAYRRVTEAIEHGSREPVPLHLRNAPTDLMRELGYGDGYRYAHDENEGVAAMDCLPPSLREEIFYRPGNHGFEREAAQRLRAAWRLAHRRASEPDPQTSRREDRSE